jgi:DNA-binding NarL/FixJ family response regulator
VVIADDQRVVRDGLAMLVGLLDDVEVVATAADGAEAVELAGRLDPDVVLMDLRMPGTDGVSATRLLRARGARPAVLVLTTFADDESLFPALQAGATGYLTKEAGSEEIDAALRAVAAGRTWLDPAVQARLVAAVTTTAPPPPEGGTAPPEAVGLPDGLTTREGEVLALIAQGLSNGEIGARLYLGQATVKTHVNRIFAKAGLRDRAQAVRYAYERGLV